MITQTDVDKYIKEKWSSLSKKDIAVLGLNKNENKDHIFAIWTLQYLSENSEFRMDDLFYYISDRWNQLSNEAKNMLNLNKDFEARAQLELLWVMQFLKENEINERQN